MYYRTCGRLPNVVDFQLPAYRMSIFVTRRVVAIKVAQSTFKIALRDFCPPRYIGRILGIVTHTLLGERIMLITDKFSPHLGKELVNVLSFMETINNFYNKMNLIKALVKKINV